MKLEAVLDKGVEFGASDIHLQVGSPVMYRIHGSLRALQMPPLESEPVAEFLRNLLGPRHWESLDRDRSVDCSYQPGEGNRFRVNAYYQRGQLSATLRIMPTHIPDIKDLNLPPAVLSLAEEERGLVLVTGTTGSGKSTTLAALIDHINENRRSKIITIEDPIEYVFENKKSLVSQRELGEDTPTFTEALRRALRQDPDIIFVGELRDYETMVTAVRAADTGHLVFSTVHTTDATQTVQRIQAMFPPEERDLLTVQLASNLMGTVSLRLAQRADDKGRIPVVELMRSTPIVRKIMMEGPLTELSSVLGSRELGMQLFDQHLVELARAGTIRNREALRLASNSDRVGMGLSGVSSQELSSGILSG